jgi:hypothetical protein
MSPLAVLSALGTFQQLRASLSGWSHRISLASIFGAAAFVFGLVTFIFLAMTLFLALSDSMSPVAAAAVVTLIFLILAVVAGFLARHAIRRGRGGTGMHASASPPALTHDPMTTAANALSGIDSRTLLAVGAGLIGGLLATQLRSRSSRTGIKQAAE